MKIKIANLIDGEARFVIENDIRISYGIVGGKKIRKEGVRTFCVSLTGKKTIQEVTAELKIMVDNAQKPDIPFTLEQIQALKGTDI